MLSETVKKIEDLISEVAKLQNEYVVRVCPGCKATCCTRVHYLFTEKDILFLRLSGQKQGCTRETFSKKGCRFLGQTGCTLGPKSRPFICHHYICPDLETEIKRCDPGLMGDLETKFRLVDLLRGQMWSEYLDSL